MKPTRILLHLAESNRLLVEPDEIYYIEASKDDSLVRLRGKTPLRDVRQLGEVETALADRGFLRIHTKYLVNLAHIRQIRKRKGSDDWEVKLDAPVNKVLPVSRGEVGKVWEALRVSSVL